MKIEVGKKYIDRRGVVSVVEHANGSASYPFFARELDDDDQNLQRFTPEGLFLENYTSLYDLIEEAVDAPPAPPPEIAARVAELEAADAAREAARTDHDTYDPPRLWALLRQTWGQGTVLPTESAARKAFPLAEGFDNYFPAATVAVAGWSKMANNKHRPGLPLGHSRGLSMDHPDCQRRHQLDALDPKRDRLEELTCKAWRALAELQEYAETLGAPAAPAATFPEIKK